MRALVAIAAARAVASALIGTVALTQESADVTVEASRLVQTKASQRTSSVPIVKIALSHGVSATGLNLATPAGAAELEKRVKDAAAMACKETSRIEPLAEPSEAECIRLSAEHAMVKARARQLVAAAGKKPAR